MRMIAAFQKTAQVRHIGHLDLLRAMQRALRRSGLPIRYSQGFNPHVVLSFAAPLSVGVDGLEELMEVALEEPVGEGDFLRMLAPSMPPSLPLLRAKTVPDPHPKLMAQLRTVGYRATLPYDERSAQMGGAIPTFLQRESIPAIRRTKSGDKPCDIRPMIHGLSSERAAEDMVFTMRLSQTERDTLKPALLMASLGEQAGVPFQDMAQSLRLTRMVLYGERDGQPVPLFDL